MVQCGAPVRTTIFTRVAAEDVPGLTGSHGRITHAYAVEGTTQPTIQVIESDARAVFAILEPSGEWRRYSVSTYTKRETPTDLSALAWIPIGVVAFALDVAFIGLVVCAHLH